MPEQRWHPGGRTNGKSGGGRFETVYTKEDMLTASANATFMERKRAPKLSDLCVIPPLDDTHMPPDTPTSPVAALLVTGAVMFLVGFATAWAVLL